ncbi:hypothetical protein [Gluconobacter sphaericus]|uniref:hypothetical protein n=1 Tax=Gluconobacter sphaericus TaxID=574987 RepID=UPI00312B405B
MSDAAEELRAKFSTYSGAILSSSRNGNRNLHTDGGGPYDSDMERRVGNLEQDAKAIQATLADMRVVLAGLATKSDIESMRSEVMAFRKEVNSMAVDVGTVKGRVQALPTLAALGTVAALLGAFGTFIVFMNRLGINHHWW